MNPFRFRLQRVLDFRRMQFQLAESECERAGIKLHSIQAQQLALATRKSETRRAFSNLPQVAGRDLTPLPDWYNWTVRANQFLGQLERGAAQEVEKKRAALVQAQRKVRLLEKLRDKCYDDWQGEFNRELDELAADSTNSGYAREKRAR
jgi:flagellar export protein FliJ